MKRVKRSENKSVSLRLQTLDTFPYLCLQDGSTLLFGSERFFEHLDMLFAVRVLVVESLELRLQSQQLRLLLRQLLLQLVNLNASKRVFGGKGHGPGVCSCAKEKKLNSALFGCYFSSVCCSLIKNAFGTDSPAFIIFYTSSLFMIDEKNSKNRTTKQWLVCVWYRLKVKDLNIWRHNWIHTDGPQTSRWGSKVLLMGRSQSSYVLTEVGKALIRLLTRWQHAKSNGSMR